VPGRSLTPRGRAAILIAVTVLALLAVRFDATPLLRGPAPYPPEWRWALDPKPWSGRVVPALACAAGLLGLLALSARAAASRRPRAACRILLACATVLGLGLQIGLRHVDEEGAVASLVRRTISGSFTSYHRVATSAFARDPRDFLVHHHELLGRFRHHGLHVATHPPGPVLFYRGLIGLCRRAPRLTARLDGMVSESGLETASLASPPPSPEAVGAALLGPLLIGLFGALACWPTAALARSLHGDDAAAVRAGMMWTLVPAVALMTPELDQSLALPVTASAAALAAALRTSQTARFGWIARAVGAGILAGIAAFFSYGAVLFVLLGTVAVLASGWPRWRAAWRRAAAILLLVLAGALAVLVLERLAGHRPLTSALAALAIHREQFTARRSYLAWLVFDPVDLFWFLGPPLAVLILGVDMRTLFRAADDRGPTVAERFRAAAVLGAGLLILSGILRGEAGRILIPIMPLLLVAAVSADGSGAEADGKGAAGPSVGLAVLIGILLTATSIVIRLTWDVP
jgi:hypothetical protein